MAAVSFLVSLVQGLPLASMFKVYKFLVCEVYDKKLSDDTHGSDAATTPLLTTTVHRAFSTAAIGLMGIPPAPELPHPPQCNDPQVQKTTSAYAACMETVGALVALVLLNRVTKISRRVGRKPMLLLPQIMFALGFTAFRVAVALPEYLGIVVLFLALVSLEASAAGPLKVGLQSYVVDTTTDSQRATALGFIDGFGQIGAFPSSTLGGFLAAVSGEFFAPFYASVALAALSFAYILILVPESKKHRHHTFIDDWEHSAEADQRHRRQEEREQRRQQRNEQQQQQSGEDAAHQQGPSRRQSYRSQLTESGSEISVYSTEANTTAWLTTDQSRWRRWLQRINFLAPLGIFRPRKHGAVQNDDGDNRQERDDDDDGASGSEERATRRPEGSWDFRLLNLAAIVVFEEVYQVFMVPMLLLYNSDVFTFDVLQNGYLVSLLQGMRALFLTAIFPPAMAWAKRSISAHVKKRREARRKARAAKFSSSSSSSAVAGQHQQNNGGERQSLLGRAERTLTSYASVDDGEAGGSRFSEMTSTTVAKAEERGKFDIFVMVASYALAAASFATLALSRSFGQPWVFLPLGLVGLQIASGATSVRTALIVNSVSEDDQGKALAANQVLCSAVYASFPLVTSLVYGLGLSQGLPELVWIFKALFASAACLGSLTLFYTHRGPSSHHSARS